MNKRFTDAELAAELWFMRWVRCTAKRLSDYGGPSEKDNERLAALRRFASLPHYDEISAEIMERKSEETSMPDSQKIISGKELESKLQMIQRHLDIAGDGFNNSAQIVHYAQADLRERDVPFLMELVVAQVELIQKQQKIIDSVADIAKRLRDITDD